MSETKSIGITLKENRVLIKKFNKVEKTDAGIILPDDQQVAPEGGEVVAVGPGAYINGLFHVPTCVIGEKVRYLEHGKVVEIDGEEYYLLRDTDIWGTIE